MPVAYALPVEEWREIPAIGLAPMPWTLRPAEGNQTESYELMMIDLPDLPDFLLDLDDMLECVSERASTETPSPGEDAAGELE
jgi:hypothetical protein